MSESVEKTFVFPEQSQGKQGPQRSEHLPCELKEAWQSLQSCSGKQGRRGRCSGLQV